MIHVLGYAVSLGELIAAICLALVALIVLAVLNLLLIWRTSRKVSRVTRAQETMTKRVTGLARAVTGEQAAVRPTTAPVPLPKGAHRPARTQRPINVRRGSGSTSV